MKRVCGMRAIATALAIASGSTLLWSATSSLASDDANFTTVSDLETFNAHFVGPKIMDPQDSANYFVVKGDGSIEGNWHGMAMAGKWRWEDRYFCRSLSAPRAAPEDCQEWGYADGKARLVRNRGEGDVTVYSLGE